MTMKEIKVGLVGVGWMGAAHASAFQNSILAFGPDPAVPILEAVCGISPEESREAARTLGFKRWASRWQDIVGDPAIDVVDIATPNSSHAEIAMAAIANGKHVYCEKPLSLSAGESRRLAEAARDAGVVTLVGYNYLKNPIQSLARKLIDDADFRGVTSFRATFDQDLLVDRDFPFTWRMERAIAGSGALGDMGSHAISLALMLVGPIKRVSGMAKTFVGERPNSTGSGYAVQASSGLRRVENEDIAQFLCEFENGAVGHFSTSRIGTGRKLGLTYEVQGRKAAICFNQERMNELDYFQQNEPAELRGYKTIYTGPEQPGYRAFHPIVGVALSYNDQKTLEVRDLITAVAEGTPIFSDFDFGYQVDRVVEATLRSVERRGWVNVEEVE
jgi:predicted dehydrogenase